MKRTIHLERKNTESSREYLLRVVEEIHTLIEKGCMLNKVSVKVECITEDPITLIKHEGTV